MEKEGVHYIALEEYRGLNSTDGLNQTELGWCFSKPWSHIRDLGHRYGFITGKWSTMVLRSLLTTTLGSWLETLLTIQKPIFVRMLNLHSKFKTFWNITLVMAK